ncbi:MAG: hypothetical protein J5529_11840 [Prevotella sp.]|nr:hypothetical protein [Prevotella sp.]
MKRLLASLLTLISAITLTHAIGPTFYYKFTVEPSPDGAGLVYASNQDEAMENIKWKSNWYQTVPFSQETKVEVKAATVTAYLYAKPNEGYFFSHWSKVNDNGTETVFSHAKNTTDLVTTTATTSSTAKNTYYKAYFVEKGLVYPVSEDETLGTVEIDNPSNKVGDKVTIRAYPDNLNGKFVGWRRPNSSRIITSNPYTLTVTNNNQGAYTAVFEERGIKTNGIYVYLENTYSHKLLGVTGTSEDSITEDQRNFTNTMMLVDKSHKKSHSLPALVLRLKGTPTGTGGLIAVDMTGQGISTYDISNLKFKVEKFDTIDYFIYGSAKGFTGYLKDNADYTTKGDMELIGSIRYPNLYNRPNNSTQYRWKFHIIDEEHLSENYFGAIPSAGTLKDGKYYTTMYTAFPYQCLDNVKAYTVDAILDDGSIHIVEVPDGIVPAYTAVLLECTSTEPSSNRLLPLTSDPEALTTPNLLKGEIWLIDGKNEESTYRTKFDPATMRVLSDEKGSFVAVNNKDDAHGNVVLEYIANNTCYLDITGHDLPEELDFTQYSGNLLGDVNDDGLVDVVDVMTIVNYILKKPVDYFNFNNGDTNVDGEIDVSDLMDVVYITLHS